MTGGITCWPASSEFFHPFLSGPQKDRNEGWRDLWRDGKAVIWMLAQAGTRR